MFNSPAWRQPTNPRTELRSARFDLRDRVPQYATDNTSTSSPCPGDPNLSPTDVFFSGPSPLADQVSAKKSIFVPPQKHRQGGGLREPEKPPKPQEHRPVLAEIQTSASPIAKELNDRIVSNGDRIYEEALRRLSTSHKELVNTIAEATTEDDRIINLLHTSERKTVKLPSETRITDERTGDEIQVGKRVAAGKERVDILEAEVLSLWGQWEAAQKEVDDIKVELTSSVAGNKGGQMRSVDGVQESLAAEMAKFEAELTAILEDAHEDARASERGFSKKVKGVMSVLLQQYLLDD